MKYLAIALVTLCMACGATKQRRAINHARTSILAAGEAIEAADKAIVTQYGDAPATDEEAYCVFKRSSLILEQAKTAVIASAGAVRTWEIALLQYLAKKDAGDPADAEWQAVLAAKGTWLDMGVQVIGIIKSVIDSLDLYGVELPSEVNYFWGLLENLGPYQGQPPEWDWTSLKNSVCYPQEVTP